MNEGGRVPGVRARFPLPPILFVEPMRVGEFKKESRVCCD